MKSPYQYTWGNPVSLTDQDGRCPDCPTFKTDDGGIIQSSIPANMIAEVTPPSLSNVLGQNRFSGWKSQGCDCGLSSNVPTSGATGYASGVVDAVAIGIGSVLVAPLMAGMSGMGLSLPTASSLSVAAKANLGASGTRFVADAAVQYTIISGQGGDFSRDYNYASGASSALISNPFLGAGLGGAFNVSRNDIDFSLSRGVASSLIGGAFGKTISKTWKPVSSKFNKLTWVGGFGETISMENPIVTGVETGINLFSKSSTKVGAKFFSDEDLSKKE